MKRTTAREIAVQLGFCAAQSNRSVAEIAESFFDEEYYNTLASEDGLFAEYPDEGQKKYIIGLAGLAEEHREELDGFIEKYARGWKASRISKTAMAVMRCAMCEVLYMDDVPNAAAINEAVEIAKGYEEPETVSFINGILGGFMRGEQVKKPAESDE